MGPSFDEAWARYAEPLLAYLARLLGNRAGAEEVRQEAFLRLHLHLAAIAGSNGALGAWLYRVATNLALDRLRRRRGRALAHDPAGRDPDPALASEHRDRDARVRSAVEALPPGLRAAFLLRAHHGLAFREVGSALEVGERAAKARYRKARDLLLRRLSRLLEDES